MFDLFQLKGSFTQNDSSIIIHVVPNLYDFICQDRNDIRVILFFNELFIEYAETRSHCIV